MNHPISLAALAAGLLVLAGCGQEPQTTTLEAEPPAPAAAATAPQPHVVELRAVGKTFEGPTEIPSGWTTIRFINASSMIHFALIDVPPEGITAQVFSDAVAEPFQEAMDAMNAGDEEGVNAAFGKFPAWINELGRNGGPGFLSPGRTGQTTMYLEPGRYIFECYIKSDGVFHTTSPGNGQIGMMLEFVVTEEKTDAPEPEATATLAITNAGLELVSGALQAGSNTIRVEFREQQALPSFVGNDVHLMRVDDDQSIALADAWLDWRTANGLEDPSPVEFLGGINDMPAGTHAYFTVDLQPGEYAFIAEIPGPQAAGFALPASVKP
jgi:hypothetical protein